MARSEQDLRTEAVRRRLAGESPEAIARSLGRSVRWVQKWVGRHQAGDEEWAAGRKRGPKRACSCIRLGSRRSAAAVENRLEATSLSISPSRAVGSALYTCQTIPPTIRDRPRLTPSAGRGRPPARTHLGGREFS